MKKEKIVKIIFLILSVILLGINAGAAQMPPPPPAPEITVTDPVFPYNDLIISIPPIDPGVIVSHEVTITNDGSTDLVIGSIASADTLDPPYGLINNMCSGQTLIPFTSCTLTIVFSPDIEGQFGDSFEISSNDPDKEIVTITISGNTIVPAANNPPSVPQLIYPAESQGGLGSSVEFRWRKCSDPENNPVNYSLFVSENPDFAGDTPILVQSSSFAVYYADTSMGIIFFGIALAGGIRKINKASLLMLAVFAALMISFSCGGGGGSSGSSGGSGDAPVPANEVSLEVSGLAAGSVYYWKVVADDGNGGVVQSEKRSFMTQ